MLNAVAREICIVVLLQYCTDSLQSITKAAEAEPWTRKLSSQIQRHCPTPRHNAQRGGSGGGTGPGQRATGVERRNCSYAVRETTTNNHASHVVTKTG